MHHFLRDIFRYAMRAASSRDRACAIQVQSNANPTSGGTRLALTLWAEDPTLDHSAPPGRHVYTIYYELSLFRDVSPGCVYSRHRLTIRFEVRGGRQRSTDSRSQIVRVCRLRENDLVRILHGDLTYLGLYTVDCSPPRPVAVRKSRVKSGKDKTKDKTMRFI